MRSKSDTLTGQELEIMKIIWPLGRATVRDIYDTLRESPDHRLHDRADDDEHPGGQGSPPERTG